MAPAVVPLVGRASRAAALGGVRLAGLVRLRYRDAVVALRCRRRRHVGVAAGLGLLAFGLKRAALSVALRAALLVALALRCALRARLALAVCLLLPLPRVGLLRQPPLSILAR